MGYSNYGNNQNLVKLKTLEMKKVLVITYYWPPSGGGGVQRWLKFTKYLPEFGWEPIVYTPEIQNAPAYDKSLLKDISANLKILRTPIWEPYGIYRLFTGRKKQDNLGAAFASGKSGNKVAEKISNWVRSNFFIPDARKFWIKPSVKFLKTYLRSNDIDAIVTTGPPHSMHLIGLKLKKLTSIKWIADFRDPWTDIDFYEELKLTRLAHKRHLSLEKKVIENADLVIAVSGSNRQQLMKKGDAEIKVIANGYDQDDVSDDKIVLDEKFTIAHIGTFMANRNPDLLWDVLVELLDEDPDFKKVIELVLIGNTDASIIKDIELKGLKKYTQIVESVSHEEAIKYQKKSQVLLLTVNKTGDTKGMITGKIFEYLVSGRPILAIGPEDGDLANILKETDTGVISDFNNKTKLKHHIKEYYQRFTHKNLYTKPKNTGDYSRKNLTGKLADFLNTLTT